MAALLDPSLVKLQQKAAAPRDELYLQDTVRWLSAILRPELLPADLSHHCVPVQSHLLAAGHVMHVSKIRKRAEEGSLDFESYQKKPGGGDTSGIVVRYETSELIILRQERGQERGSEAIIGTRINQ